MGVAKCDTLYQNRTVNESFTPGRCLKKGLKKLKVKELNNMSKGITLSEVNKLESRKLKNEK